MLVQYNAHTHTESLYTCCLPVSISLIIVFNSKSSSSNLSLCSLSRIAKLSVKDCKARSCLKGGGIEREGGERGGERERGKGREV